MLLSRVIHTQFNCGFKKDQVFLNRRDSDPFLFQCASTREGSCAPETKHPTALAEKEIHEFGIRKYFGQIISGMSDKTVVLQQLCREHAIPFANAVYVGDRCEDIKEGQLAGNKVIGIAGHHPRHILEQHNPDYLVDSLPEVYECLRRNF